MVSASWPRVWLSEHGRGRTFLEVEGGVVLGVGVDLVGVDCQEHPGEFVLGAGALLL